jgi:hypothetical protein
MSILSIGELFNIIELSVQVFRHKKAPTVNAEAFLNLLKTGRVELS